MINEQRKQTRFKKNSRKLNVAVIGVGNMGSHHARNYFKMPQANLTAIADLNKDLGKKIANKFNCMFYDDYKDMLAKEEINTVSVVVPTILHEKVSTDVINYGKHLLVEKPLSHNVKSAERIVQAAKNKGVKLAVGHVERFNNGVIKLKELLTKNELGEILGISIERVGLPWPKVTEVNVIIDLAIHDIDILYYFLGTEPNHVWAHGGISTHSQEDYAKILLTYGKIGSFVEVNWKTPVKIRKVEITGSSAYAELDLIKQKLVIYRGIKKSVGIENYSEFLKKWKPVTEIINFQKNEPLRTELESFLSSIISDSEPLVSGIDGLKAVQLAEKITSKIKRD